MRRNRKVCRDRKTEPRLAGKDELAAKRLDSRLHSNQPAAEIGRLMHAITIALLLGARHCSFAHCREIQPLREPTFEFFPAKNGKFSQTCREFFLQ